MKTQVMMFGLLAALAAGAALADTTISATHYHAYGANIGWINARSDVTNGAVIGEYNCSGFLYGANIGWINLGDGTPTNGIRYGNNAADDFGVNHDGLGHLYGRAYGANVGWITFETNYGRPRIDLLTGTFDGYAYGANIGWISLSNTYGFVETDEFRDTDSDGDGIADAWEYTYTNALTALTATGDWDGDGVPDVGEFASDTDPLSADEFPRITDEEVLGGTTSQVVWASAETRLYYIEKSESATNDASWTDSGLGVQNPDAGASTARSFPDSGTSRFYRVRATRPPAE